MTDQTKPCPVQFLALTTHAGALYGVSKAGQLLALYVYGPLAQAYAAEPRYGIDFAPKWPRYARNFVLEYLPFPELDSEQLPDDLEPKISVQQRCGGDGQPCDRQRPWTQTVYNGWPLYFALGGPHDPATATHPMLFVPATVDMPAPQDMPVSFLPDATALMEQDRVEDSGRDPGYPGPWIGP